MYEKVDAREATTQYQVTPVETKWTDTNKACEGVSPCKSDHEFLQENSKVKIGQICTNGLLQWKRSMAKISIAAGHKHTFSIMHIDVSRAYFHATVQRLVLVRLPLEDGTSADAGK